MSEIESDSAPKRRFSSRVPYYVKYRPSYPHAILEYLATAMGFSADSIVDDIGCGTGLLAKLFLKNGNIVYGVEPNADMRAAGERYLSRYPQFHSIDGAAEETTLVAGSVDFISAGQAFHWFDVDACKAEFARILRPGGSVVLAWNSPVMEATPFMQAFRAAEAAVPGWRDPVPPTEPPAPRKQHGRERLFGEAGHEKQVFSNRQEFDREGLIGRVLSESGAPLPGDPRHEALIEDLNRAFDQFQENGRIEFLYLTEVYTGRLG